MQFGQIKKGNFFKRIFRRVSVCCWLFFNTTTATIKVQQTHNNNKSTTNNKQHNITYINEDRPVACTVTRVPPAIEPVVFPEIPNITSCVQKKKEKKKRE